MNPNIILSPAVVHAMAITIVGTSALMVAAHTGTLALAASRTALSPAKKLGVPLLAAALLAAWLAWAVLAVGDRVAAPEPAPLAGQLVQQPSLLLDMALFVAVGVAALFASGTVREVNKAMPSEWLIAVQAYRVEGAFFLWPMLAAGALPAGFALAAGIGDVATGIAAPFVALAVARNRPGARARAVAWNLFGILDLFVATTMAVLTHSTNIARFPIVVVPLFLGPPIGILTHIYSLRNLRVNRREGAPADR